MRERERAREKKKVSLPEKDRLKNDLNKLIKKVHFLSAVLMANRPEQKQKRKREKSPTRATKKAKRRDERHDEEKHVYHERKTIVLKRLVDKETSSDSQHEERAIVPHTQTPKEKRPAKAVKKQHKKHKAEGKKDRFVEYTCLMNNDEKIAENQRSELNARHMNVAQAKNILVARERQSEENLSLRNDRSNRLSGEAQRFLKRHQQEEEKEREADSLSTTLAKTHEHPLSHLVDLCFLAQAHMPLDEAFRAISQDFHESAERARFFHQQKEKARSKQSKQQLQLQKPDKEKYEKPGSMKFNMTYGSYYWTVGYSRETSRKAVDRLESQQAKERAELFRRFYENDQLEEEVKFGTLPNDFSMLRQIREKNHLLYARRDSLLRDLASRTPLVDMEIVTREYIREFRYPPLDENDGPRCANGLRCLFNRLFAGDKSVCYVGKAFVTPLQKQWLEERQRRGEQHRSNEKSRSKRRRGK